MRSLATSFENLNEEERRSVSFSFVHSKAHLKLKLNDLASFDEDHPFRRQYIEYIKKTMEDLKFRRGVHESIRGLLPEHHLAELDQLEQEINDL